MKKILFILVFFILYISSIVLAQYTNLQVKEAYEKARKWYTETYYTVNVVDPIDVAPSGDVTDPARLQNYKGIAEAIQSHITMYRATKDKAHLIKAINMGMDLVLARTYYFTWADFNRTDETQGYWYDGFPAAAIAELAYIMIAHPDYYPDIINTPVPVPLLTNQVPAGLPSSPTYGDFGSWFRDRVNETMVYYYTNYWADDAGFLFGELSSGNCGNKTYHKGLEAVNMHSPLTVAAMYLKAIDPNATMGSIPGKIAAFYFNQIPIDARDAGCSPFIEDGTKCQNMSVVNLNSTYNAYWWFYNGWSRGVDINNCQRTCSRPCKTLTAFLEDFGHADFTMEFPIHAIPFGYFSNNDMIRWRNTFAKLIWDPYHPLGPGFHSAVNGVNDHAVSVDVVNDCGSSLNCPRFWGVPLMFSPLYKFDGADGTATAPNVYDIVMNYYQNKVEQAVITNDTKQSSRSIYGLARLASAQWDKECTNLTLYNRDVVYDQNFFAKNILTIAPNQTTDPFYTKDNSGNPSSFADPVITTTDFTVEPGVEANFSAGERIVVKKGHIKAGAKSRGYIDPNLASICMDGNRVQNTQNTTHNNSVVANAATIVFSDKQKSNDSSIPHQFSITPNPSNGKIQLAINYEQSSGQKELSIYNTLGQLIYQSTTPNSLPSGGPGWAIDLSSYPRGIYFLKVQSADGKIYTEKIVLQ